MDGPGSANLLPCYSVADGNAKKVFFSKQDASAFADTLPNAKVTPEVGFTLWDPAQHGSSTVYLLAATCMEVSGNQAYPS